MKKLFLKGSIGLIGAALIGAMLVLAFAACPADTDDPPDPNNGNNLSSNTEISNVKIGGGAVVDLPSGNEDITKITRQRYDLPIENTEGVVTLQLTRHDAGQKISWLKTTGNPSDSAFVQFASPASGDVLSADLSSSGLAHSDRIFIKVAAENGKAVLYYGFTITVGGVAEFASLLLNGVEVAYPGKPGGAGGSSWDPREMEVGAFYAPDGGTVSLAASAKERGTVAYFLTNKSLEDEQEPAFIDLSGTANLALSTGSLLYIKLTSQNGLQKLFYRIDIFTKASTTVLYGQPTISLGASGGEPTLDPLWATQDWQFSISRLNLAEETPSYRFYNINDANDARLYYNETGYGHTQGRAKAFWDDKGLYIYAEMTFLDYRRFQSTAPITTFNRFTTVTPSGVADSDAHLYDFLEIFTNERLQAHTTGNYGIQYRVAPSPAAESKAGTNSRVSGTAPSGSNAITTFRDSGTYYTWIRPAPPNTRPEDRDLGYSIIAYIPWGYKNEASQVFGSDGKVSTTGDATGPAIGMEFQINAATTNSGISSEYPDFSYRDAVLSWNAVDSSSYQEVKNYGTVTLITGDLATRGITRGAKD